MVICNRYDVLLNFLPHENTKPIKFLIGEVTHSSKSVVWTSSLFTCSPASADIHFVRNPRFFPTTFYIHFHFLVSPAYSFTTQSRLLTTLRKNTFENIAEKKKKLLVTSIFSFSCNVFYPIILATFNLLYANAIDQGKAKI